MNNVLGEELLRFIGDPEVAFGLVNREAHIPYWERDLETNNVELYNFIKKELSNLSKPLDLGLKQIKQWFIDFGLPEEDIEGLSAGRYSAPIKIEILLRNNRKKYDYFIRRWISFKFRTTSKNKLNKEMKHLWQQTFDEKISKFEIMGLINYIDASRALVSSHKKILYSNQLLREYKKRIKKHSKKLGVKDNSNDFFIRYDDPFVVISNHQTLEYEENYKVNIDEDDINLLNLIKEFLTEEHQKNLKFHSNRCHQNSLKFYEFINNLKKHKIIPENISNEICIGSLISPIPIGMEIIDGQINQVEYSLAEVKHSWNKISGILIDVTLSTKGIFEDKEIERRNPNDYIYIYPPKNFLYRGFAYDDIDEYKNKLGK
ncbi:MAG: hypothetical protein ACOCRK_04395 [bacterium]